MKTYHLLILLLLGIVCFPGCKEKSDITNLEEIYVDVDHVKVFDFANITDSVFSIIPLESNDSCLIAKIDKIEFKNNFIYILDILAKSIFIFDENGAYVNRVFHCGNGPGEYIEIIDMTVLDTMIIVIDNYSGKQIEYNLDGSFLRENRIFDKIWAMSVFSLGSKLFYVNQWSDSNMGKYRLFSFNMIDNTIDADLSFNSEPIGLGINGPLYSIQNNEACMLFSNCDTIYAVSENNKAKPKYHVTYSGEKAKYSEDVTKVFRENPKTSILGVNQIHESQRYLFLNVSTVGDRFNVIYDKKTKQSITVDNLMHHSLYGDAPSTVWRVCGNKLIHYYDPAIQIGEYNSIYKKRNYKSELYKETLDKIMRSYDSEDNPILFIYNLKL